MSVVFAFGASVVVLAALLAMMVLVGVIGVS